MSRAAAVPEHTARLFPDLDPLADEGRAFLIGRILEEGDGDDLCWLTTVVTEAELARWVARAGARQLSRRSRSYWSLLLGADAGVPSASAVALWPLA